MSKKNEDQLILNSKTQFILEKLEKSNIWQKIDPELIPLINTLNSFPGITSDVCCTGHKKHFPYVYFTVDGTNDSTMSLAAIVDGFLESNWIVIGQMISGEKNKCLYYVAVPFEALKSQNNKPCFIKIPMEDMDVEFNFETVAEKIHKKLNKPYELRKPLFKIPNEL